MIQKYHTIRFYIKNYGISEAFQILSEFPTFLKAFKPFKADLTAILQRECSIVVFSLSHQIQITFQSIFII